MLVLLWARNGPEIHVKEFLHDHLMTSVVRMASVVLPRMAKLIYVWCKFGEVARYMIHPRTSAFMWNGTRQIDSIRYDESSTWRLAIINKKKTTIISFVHLVDYIPICS